MIKLLHALWHNGLSHSMVLQRVFMHEPFLTLQMTLTLAWKRYRVQQNYHNPTVEMKKSANYFADTNVKLRADANANSFTDKESKDTYLDMIKFRQTQDTRYLHYHGWRTQYFKADFLKYGENECLIDCGAFIGDTAYRFNKLLTPPPPRYSSICQIVCFEPDEKIYKLLKRSTRKLNGIRCINGGVSDEDCEIGFSMTGQSTSKVDEDAQTKIKLYKIDSFIDELPRVTFIKMDIEGAELAALKGAVEVIRRDMPRLAICIYHSDEDMVVIPEWVRVNFPQYKLYVRHHNVNAAETVLYAVAER